MVELSGFWAYVHNDDDADKGRIIQLSRDIKAEFEMQTGDKLDLFVDRDNLEWGEAWRQAIDSKLNSVAFFIPIITPRFFNSHECGHELQTFARYAESVGIRDLVLPILYVNVPDFYNDDNEDDLIQLIKSLHWKDWTKLRLKGVESEDYRQGVAEVAGFIANINRNAVQRIPSEEVNSIETLDEEVDNSPGTIEILANFEEQLSIIPLTLNTITENLHQISEITESATVEIKQSDNISKGFGSRLVILRKTSTKLANPIEEIFNQCNIYASQIHDIDIGVRLYIEQSIEVIENETNSKIGICEFFNSIQELQQVSMTSMSQVQSLSNSVEPLSKLSRDMRPVIRKLQRAITIFIEATGVTQLWVEMIDSTGINCENLTT